jgi:hypothetical protein
MAIVYSKEPSKKGYNLKRTLTFSSVATFYIGPQLHFHYSILLPYFVPRVTATSALKKTAIDQLVFAPYSIFLFYLIVNVVEGKGIR